MTSKVAKLQRACLRDPVKVEVRRGTPYPSSHSSHAALLSAQPAMQFHSQLPRSPFASPLLLPAPLCPQVASKYSTVETLRQQYMFVPAKYKDCYLAFLLTGK